ncbi:MULTISPECIES: hypothetical protein [unclassified Bradyrhizobium]|uniref:hypothetical protein n=1 Tax=unclassified Bradyrhizobium TaxID=2631580 RepID=UPI002FF08EE9
MLTKTDIAAIRKADDITIHLGANHAQGLVRLIKRKGWNAQPFETDQEYILPCHVTVETTSARDALERGVASFFAMAGIYHSQRSPVSSILKTLKAGDELTFSFYPDGHTNGYVAAAGLHADILYLHVRNKAGRKTWEFDVSVCANNSARMCRGVPNGADYERSANERRALA